MEVHIQSAIMNPPDRVGPSYIAASSLERRNFCFDMRYCDNPAVKTPFLSVLTLRLQDCPLQSKLPSCLSLH